MLSGSMRTLLIVLGFQAVPYIGTSRNITDSRAGSKFKVNTEPEPIPEINQFLQGLMF